MLSQIFQRDVLISQDCYTDEDGLELLTFLSLPSECWDYKHIPAYLVFVVLELNLVLLER